MGAEERSGRAEATSGDGEGRLRAFLAIPLTAELLAKVQQVQEALAQKMPGVRWTNPDTMHLTLKFFGDIPEEFLEKIGKVMLSIGHLNAPFSVDISGVGAFPSPARPRVIWLGIRDAAALKTLHAGFESALTQIGIAPEERPFAPHLTLGRVRSGPIGAHQVPDAFREVGCGALPVDKVVLFESRLRPAGALHVPIKTVMLGN